MAKFKDNQTGNVYEFTAEHDIKTMQRHPEYVEVVEEEPKKAPKKTEAKKED